MLLSCQTCGGPCGIYTHCFFCMTLPRNRCKCGKMKDKKDEKCSVCVISCETRDVPAVHS